MSWGYVYRSYIEFVLDLLKQNPPNKMIDIGCGDGRLIYEINKHLPKVNISGVDYSSGAVGFAKAFNPKIDLYVGDISNPSFSVGSYDTATLIETLEHIPPETIDNFVKSIHKILEKEGRLIITVPSTNIPLNKKHYQHFTLDSLKKTLTPYFCLEEYYYTNTRSISENIIKKILNNSLYSIHIGKINNLLYRYYKKKLFNSNKNNASRIIGIFKKNSDL